MAEQLKTKNSVVGGYTPSVRNYGIDLLRLFSMFLVVILHVLGQGGVLKNTSGFSNHLAWLLEIFAYCAVDCYALISGYVGYTDQPKPFRTSKYVKMWVQVFTYSFGITLMAYLLGIVPYGGKTVLKTAFSVIPGRYWYFTAYTGVFFLMPWLNRFIRSCGKRDLTRCVVVLFGLFSVMQVTALIVGDDLFYLHNGYSMLWLCVMYIVGAWMKKCAVPEKIKSRYAWLVTFGCLLLSWGAKQFLLGGSAFVDYLSPTIVAIAVAFVTVFSKLRLPPLGEKAVRFLAPAAFGVYLIHCQKVIWEFFMKDRFIWIAELPWWLLPLAVIGCAFAIFAVCLFIEKIRLWLFRILRIDVLTDKIGNGIDHLRYKLEAKLLK